MLLNFLLRVLLLQPYLKIGKNKTLKVLQLKRGRLSKKAKDQNQRKFPNLLKEILKDVKERKGNFEEHKREYEIKGGYLYKEDDGIQHNFDKRSKASIKSNNDGNRKC